MRDANRRVYVCTQCGSVYLIYEKMWNLANTLLCGCGTRLRTYSCVLYHARESDHVGTYEKCEVCDKKFLCITTTPHRVYG